MPEGASGLAGGGSAGSSRSRGRVVSADIGNGTVDVDGVRFRIGDFVYLNSSSSSSSGSLFVAQLERFVRSRPTNDRHLVEVRWLYRPEDTHTGRQEQHGVAEVFDSDHRDINEVTVLRGHCKVLSVRGFGREVAAHRRLQLPGFESAAKRQRTLAEQEPRRVKQEPDEEQAGEEEVDGEAAAFAEANLPPDVFFCRRGYNPSRSRFYNLPTDGRFGSVKSGHHRRAHY